MGVKILNKLIIVYSVSSFERARRGDVVKRMLRRPLRKKQVFTFFLLLMSLCSSPLPHHGRAISSTSCCRRRDVCHHICRSFWTTISNRRWWFLSLHTQSSQMINIVKYRRDVWVVTVVWWLVQAKKPPP